jgi:hypothetical protein
MPAVTSGLKGIATLLSELITAVQRNDTSRQVVVVDAFKPCVLHHGFQGVLIGCIRIDSAR